MIGGDQSFALGGYYKTTLEEILPVRSNFKKQKEKPSLAMVLFIDSVDVARRYINEADTHLTLIRPGLNREDIELAQTAPGRYEAEFATEKITAYHLELSQQPNGSTAFRQTRGFVVGYPNELRLGPPDEKLMRRITEVSGGRYAPTVAQVFDPGNRIAQHVTRLCLTS